MGKRQYREVATILSKDKVIEVAITESELMNGDKLFTFSPMRRYKDQNGDEQRTPWLYQRHIASLMEVLPQVEERLRIEHEKALASKRALR